jgi:hypothetical protein
VPRVHPRLTSKFSVWTLASPAAFMRSTAQATALPAASDLGDPPSDPVGQVFEVGIEARVQHAASQ